jgi:hypothetical protein
MNEQIQFLQASIFKPKVGFARQMIDQLSQQGIRVFYLEGRNIFSKETFLSQTAEVMKFPSYFGNNWDAFEECITDLAWCPAQEYISRTFCTN